MKQKCQRREKSRQNDPRGDRRKKKDGGVKAGTHTQSKIGKKTGGEHKKKNSRKRLRTIEE